MNLIDVYVSEVGKHLPRKMRADIEAELRSILEDMLEDRSKKAGRPVDDEMVKELLKEYGAPQKVAASYLPERHLIGPRLYPLFMLVLKIVFSVLGVLALIGFGVSATSMTPQAFIELLGKVALPTIGGAITAFGNIVLVFAILERVLPASEQEDVEDKEWNPATLQKGPEPDRVGLAGPVFEILLNLTAIVIFNFYPQLLSFGYSASSVWFIAGSEVTKDQIGTTSILSEAFFRYVPFLTVVWVLEIVHNAILLRQGRWQPATRWFSLGVKLANVGICIALLAGPSLIGLTTESLTVLGSLANSVIVALNSIVRLVLVLVIVLDGIDIVKTILRLWPRKTPSARVHGK